MNTRHSQSVTVSDDYRANVILVPALVISLVLVMGLGVNPVGESGEWLTDQGRDIIGTYLLAWPVFGLVYLSWTHLSLRELDETELIVHSKWATNRSKRPWVRFFTNGGPIAWTTTAAFLAIILNIVITVVGSEQDLILGVAIGLLNVAVSWAVMAYAFALAYLRLDLREGGSAAERQFEFQIRGERSFGDYLTFAIAASTMSAALPGHRTTTSAWTLTRTNVIVAFAFNSVVVATIVSLIFSHLTG